jgi:hypothetical protein
MALPAGLSRPNKNLRNDFHLFWDIRDENMASLGPFEK